MEHVFIVGAVLLAALIFAARETGGWVPYRFGLIRWLAVSDVVVVNAEFGWSDALLTVRRGQAALISDCRFYNGFCGSKYAISAHDCRD